jgi:DNA-binding transcriptional ArsR family regulator
LRSSPQNEPHTSALSLTAVLYALSDETRLRVIESLAETDEIACGDFNVGMPKSSLSHHLRVLRSSGIISTRREGTALFNRLRKGDVDKRFPGLLDSVLQSWRKRKRRTKSQVERKRQSS